MYCIVYLTPGTPSTAWPRSRRPAASAAPSAPCFARSPRPPSPYLASEPPSRQLRYIGALDLVRPLRLSSSAFRWSERMACWIPRILVNFQEGVSPYLYCCTCTS